MKKTIPIIILVTLCFMVMQAQDTAKEVQKIRTQYNLLKPQIGKKTNDLMCLYLEDNKNEQQREGERYYNEKIYFYYTPDERELKMVIFEKQFGIRSTYAEYMLDNGSLTFAFEQQNEDKATEKRLYLRNGKAVKYSEGNKDKNMAENEDEIAMLNKAAFQMVQIFNSYMLRD